MNKVRKQISVTISFCDCEDCPKYHYDFDDGGLCLFVIPAKCVDRSGKGIPDWCPLRDDV